MVDKFKLVFRSGIAGLLVLGCLTVIEGQKLVRCKVKDIHAPRYKIGSTVRTGESEAQPVSATLLVMISIKPQHFNRDDMIALARRLNREYCIEQNLTVLIFDNHQSAGHFSASYESETQERDLAALRGNYHINRQTGEEVVLFSKDPAKPREMVKIELNRESSKRESSKPDF